MNSKTQRMGKNWGQNIRVEHHTFWGASIKSTKKHQMKKHSRLDRACN
jgi:hypothetical protein